MKPFEDPSRRTRAIVATLYLAPLVAATALAMAVVPPLLEAMEEPPAPVQTDRLDDLSVRDVPEPAGCRCECHREPELKEASRP